MNITEKSNRIRLKFKAMPKPSAFKDLEFLYGFCNFAARSRRELLIGVAKRWRWLFWKLAKTNKLSNFEITDCRRHIRGILEKIPPGVRLFFRENSEERHPIFYFLDDKGNGVNFAHEHVCVNGESYVVWPSYNMVWPNWCNHLVGGQNDKA